MEVLKRGHKSGWDLETDGGEGRGERAARRVKEEEEWQILDAHRPLDGFLVLVLVEGGVVSLAGVFLRRRGE